MANTQRSPLKHTLLIGTTGMLGGLTSRIANEPGRCTLLARDLEKMCSLAPHALHLPTRWDDPDGFSDALAQAQWTNGPIDLAVAWIHSGHEATWEVLLDALPTGAMLVEVVGSASLDPSKSDLSHRDSTRAMGVHHVRAALGYALRDDGRARWLTHDEISLGVLDVVASSRDGIVGRADPWPPSF